MAGLQRLLESPKHNLSNDYRSTLEYFRTVLQSLSNGSAVPPKTEVTELPCDNEGAVIAPQNSSCLGAHHVPTQIPKTTSNLYSSHFCKGSYIMDDSPPGKS